MIFGRSIKKAEKKSPSNALDFSIANICFLFDVGRWTFDVERSSFNIVLRVKFFG